MIGRTLGHYQITDKLGQGGMGVVYTARDTHLDRFVAVKTLPPERVSDPERKRRFVQEAKAASALNHPNIIHVYDIDQAEGTDYIAMEYVEGKTLDHTAAATGRSRIYIAPFRAEGRIAQDQWIAATDGLTFDDKPRWSPDGNLLYHVSDRDGFRCIWVQRLHPATKQPVGAPLAVYHSHSARRSLRNMENARLNISVAAGRLAFSMAERTGNIWMAELER